MNDKTIVVIFLCPDCFSYPSPDLKKEMTYKEYREEWGPAVSESATIIDGLKYPQMCVIHNEPMYFFGNPYGKRFGESECTACVMEERERRFAGVE